MRFTRKDTAHFSAEIGHRKIVATLPWTPRETFVSLVLAFGAISLLIGAHIVTT